jgi:hypothetical protein
MHVAHILPLLAAHPALNMNNSMFWMAAHPALKTGSILPFLKSIFCDTLLSLKRIFCDTLLTARIASAEIFLSEAEKRPL